MLEQKTMMEPESDKSAIVEFGRFTVLPFRRELLAEGAPIELGGRAFDVLLALIEARGTVLSKEELIGRVWPGRVVEDNNLQVQIAALRKIFAGEHDLIRTVTGRGYQFTGEIRTGAAPSAVSAPSTNLSKPVTELIGRDVELEEVLQLAADHRLVTLTGVGGIGKTRLGLEAAHQLLPRFADGIWLAELGPLANPEVVPVTVATAFGLTLSAGSMTAEHIAMALGTKRVLLVLDNCEHVIEAAARMVEVLLRSTPSTCVLATSREPLRAPGEFVYRVPPLEVPGEELLGREDLLKAGSVKLFMARARDAEPQFSPDKRVAAIAAICRQLDGIPLAIELAAARTSALGVEGLAATARRPLQTSDRRAPHRAAAAPDAARHSRLELRVAPRDRTRGATPAVRVCRQFFAGSGERRCGRRHHSRVRCLRLRCQPGREVTRHRRFRACRHALPVTGNDPCLCRRKAQRKWRISGVRSPSRRVSQGPCSNGRKPIGKPSPRPTGLPRTGARSTTCGWRWTGRFRRTAIREIGVILTVAAVPLWMHLSLIVECRARVEHALAAVSSGLILGARSEMRLHAALAWSLMYTAGPLRETGAAWINAIEMAERLNDAEYQLRALWGLWIYHLSSGESRATLAVAQRFCSLATGKASPAEVLVGERMVGVSLHYMGDQIGARRYLERVLGNYVAPAHRSHAIRFQFDQRVSARATLVRVLWLQGLPDQAGRAVKIAIADARYIDHALSLALALEAACLLDLFLGDLDAAERSMAVLLDHAGRHAIGRWHAWGHCFEGVLRASRGDFDAGLQLLRVGLDDLRRTRFALFYIKFLGDFADALGRAGQIAQGIEAIDEALARSERNDERWYMAELLRIKGELVVMAGAPNAAAEAEPCFTESLDWARRQGALSWELRSAMSLARLWHVLERTDEARDLLVPLYGRFTEGFETADLRAARSLQESLRKQ